MSDFLWGILASFGILFVFFFGMFLSAAVLAALNESKKKDD